ncbi:MAG: phosphatidate cytidylyltransferase [Calditrichaeota bacterium]|nr:MAG: phosphatidate cytidylyltransferase [Calditrichota bacterium]
MKELAVRVAVAVVGIPLLLFIILKGGLYFYLLSIVVTILGQWEMYQLLRQKGSQPMQVAGLFSGQILLALIYIGSNALLILLLLIFVLFIFGAEMFRNNGSPLINTSATILGIVYPTLFWGSLLFLRENVGSLWAKDYSFGGKFILLMFVAIWICDTFAYFLGKQFGKHRLFERVSPKKSWEGAVAGLIGALLTYLLVYFQQIIPITLNVAIVGGLIVGTAGQFGDLVESWFKRDAGVKDSSNLLPGHGGILDRFDSVLFSSVAFLALYFILQIK